MFLRCEGAVHIVGGQVRVTVVLLTAKIVARFGIVGESRILRRGLIRRQMKKTAAFPSGRQALRFVECDVIS